ncbi:hypothetical protein [Rhodobacteraceae bacterium DSL-40]|uniref:hypothetical protein n=1 Tax=Amaricoccus sp. B4 TaxID=3368557 RepID=UPI0013A6B487
MNRRNFFGSGATLLSLSASPLLAAPRQATAGPVFPLQPRLLDAGSLEAIRTAEALEIGDFCRCPKGTYRIVAANSYPANGRTVVDLSGIEGQAVLAPTEPLADMTEMLEDTRPSAWFSEADLVRTRAENFTFEVAQADTSGQLLSNSAGARFRVVEQPIVAFDAFGGGFNRSGIENAAALLRAFDFLGARGGRILFGSGTYRFNPTIYPVTGATLWMIGAGFRATRFIPSVYNGDNRIWMMEFGKDEEASYLGFSGIDVVAPQAPERARFNGIRICSTNQLILHDCYGRFVDGTAWQLERAHNSKIDIRSYKSGSSEDGVHSVLISGTLGDYGRDEDAVFNDTVIVGFTEQDFLGWKIENGLVIRPESSIKVHGGPGATRSLHLHRITNGAMSVYPTLGFDSDAFMVVSDAGSSEKQTIPVQNASEPTRFNLNIISNSNIRNFGKETAALLAIDCATPGSRVIVTGDLLRNVKQEGDYRYVRLVGPGNANAEIDLSSLKFQDEDVSKWIEDRRTQASRIISRRATGLFLPPVIGFTEFGNAQRLPGQTDYIVTNGGSPNAAAPRMSLIGVTEATGAPGGTLLYSAMQPITASAEGAVTARTLIASQRLNIPQHDRSDGAAALLRRLTVGASGITGSHDPDNFWQVRVYVGDVATGLVLRRDQTSQTQGDGLPSKMLAGWNQNSLGFDFHQGIGQLTVREDQTFTLRLEPLGTPPALEDITVTAYFEMRI